MERLEKNNGYVCGNKAGATEKLIFKILYVLCGEILLKRFIMIHYMLKLKNLVLVNLSYCFTPFYCKYLHMGEVIHRL